MSVLISKFLSVFLLKIVRHNLNSVCVGILYQPDISKISSKIKNLDRPWTTRQ